MSDISRKISLSVIVPCFNMAPYLDRALNCLSKQWDGRTDYEIILVNDASTDNTLDILNEYKSSYPVNVVVVDRKLNGGLGAARNSGLEAAKGDWVVFFDPDDALADNGYAKMLELTRQKEFDILSFGVKNANEFTWNDSMIDPVAHSSIDWLGSGKDFMLNFHYATSIKYFFKRDLVADSRFSSLALLEDMVFVLPIFLSDIKVALTKTIVYYYIMRQSSLTNIINSQKMSRCSDDILSAIKIMEQYKQGQSDAIKLNIEEHQLKYRGNLIARLMLSDKCLGELKRHRDALNEMSIPRNHGRGKKERLYDFLIEHPVMLFMSRPIYRTVRSLHRRWDSR